MTAPVLAFFNNKGGVGKTSLLFHIGWMASELGCQVLFADLDPQANLTAAFLPDEVLEQIWPITGYADTVFGAVSPLLEVGGIRSVRPTRVGEGRYLLAGDIALSRFEDALADSWPKCLAGDFRAFHIMSALWRVSLPTGAMRATGYVLQQHGIRRGKPTRAFQTWMDRVPGVYRTSLLAEPGDDAPPIERDEHCLAQIKNYASLMPMAQDARKPVFALTAADGAFGGHQQAAQRAYSDFRVLTRRVLDAVGVTVD